MEEENEERIEMERKMKSEIGEVKKWRYKYEGEDEESDEEVEEIRRK
jgi:hypothetical protein